MALYPIRDYAIDTSKLLKNNIKELYFHYVGILSACYTFTDEYTTDNHTDLIDIVSDIQESFEKSLKECFKTYNSENLFFDSGDLTAFRNDVKIILNKSSKRINKLNQ